MRTTYNLPKITYVNFKLEVSELDAIWGEKKLNMKGANHASPFQQDKVADPVNNTHVLTF